MFANSTYITNVNYLCVWVVQHVFLFVAWMFFVLAKFIVNQ